MIPLLAFLFKPILSNRIREHEESLWGYRRSALLDRKPIHKKAEQLL